MITHSQKKERITINSSSVYFYDYECGRCRHLGPGDGRGEKRNWRMLCNSSFQASATPSRCMCVCVWWDDPPHSSRSPHSPPYLVSLSLAPACSRCCCCSPSLSFVSPVSAFARNAMETISWILTPSLIPANIINIVSKSSGIPIHGL